MFRSLCAATFGVGFFVMSASGAAAWGAKGHKIVGQIAEEHLTNEAWKRVHALLDADGSEDMAAVSRWADRTEVRSLPGSFMHSVRMTMDDEGYNDQIDCPKHRCVVAGIENAERILSDASSSLIDQVNALKYLIHFVGDIHQPLHTVKKTGARSVIFDGVETTLHKVWDTGILSNEEPSYRKLAAEIESNVDLNPYTGGGPRDWAVEGRDIAMNEIFSEVSPGTKSSPPVVLADGYASEHWPTIELRLKQAGLRLANVLNDIYRDEAPSLQLLCSSC